MPYMVVLPRDCVRLPLASHMDNITLFASPMSSGGVSMCMPASLWGAIIAYGCFTPDGALLLKFRMHAFRCERAPSHVCVLALFLRVFPPFALWLLRLRVLRCSLLHTFPDHVFCFLGCPLCIYFYPQVSFCRHHSFHSLPAVFRVVPTYTGRCCRASWTPWSCPE